MLSYICIEYARRGDLSKTMSLGSNPKRNAYSNSTGEATSTPTARHTISKKHPVILGLPCILSLHVVCRVSDTWSGGYFRLSLKMHYRYFTSEIPSRHCREHVNCWIWNQVWSMHLPMPSAFATRRVYSRGFDFMAMALSPGNADTTDAQRLRN